MREGTTHNQGIGCKPPADPISPSPRKTLSPSMSEVYPTPPNQGIYWCPPPVDSTKQHKELTSSSTKKVKSQLPLYYSQIREKYARTDTMIVQVKFTPQLESILSLSSSDIGKLVTMPGSTLSIPGLMKPTKECQVEKVETFNVNISRDTPCYSGISFLPKDRAMLVDKTSSQCILLNNSHHVVTKYKLGNICDICVVSAKEVAISVYDQKRIQILSIREDIISPVRNITTKYRCYRITTAGNGQLVAIGDCGNNKYCWSLIKDGREVNYSDQCDSSSGWYNYIAVNSSNTLVYVTVSNTNSLHCFNMKGRKMYTYSPDNLKWPYGVAVDREDNIYVVGHDSHNIHQLSPEGCLIQVITTGVPQNPWAICFDNIRDTFIITSNTISQNLHIYQLK
ncbi:hypothetical protein CHS0354_004936 [Potamilus streckersoni]|uniref:SMP-30/Gluconolactonase/LRE-like region domain-containing protein n=1 Tax=Potamilus streckersoni TaxID=2493646 RepID=A0AAE0TJY0_9BIVA|nr:hypothetical protein CHS0354_004936 [Potamilus streckersoni]